MKMESSHHIDEDLLQAKVVGFCGGGGCSRNMLFLCPIKPRLTKLPMTLLPSNHSLYEKRCLLFIKIKHLGSYFFSTPISFLFIYVSIKCLISTYK